VRPLFKATAHQLSTALVLVAVVFAQLGSVQIVYSQERTDESSEDSTAPRRVNDLAYGRVLFEYYQGNAFEALSALNVAKLQGGIQGHGDHPALVEGGLMLSYGMAQEAKLKFESVLKDQVSASDRNKAWFYLGKVFYLQQEYTLALESFDKVYQHVLQADDSRLLHELFYLKGQIAHFTEASTASVQSQINALPAGHIWQSYLRYNQIVSLMSNQGIENKEIPDGELADNSPTKQLRELASLLEWQYSESKGDYPVDKSMLLELLSLKEQCLLTLGKIYLQNLQYQAAFDVLKLIQKDSVFSDQALFSYAVAAANLKKNRLALQALNTLKDRALFTPWLQQVPYALAYLYEQLNEPALALQAYRAAAEHYFNLTEKLSENEKSLSEQKIIDALSLKANIGSEGVTNDAYGLITVQPQDFNMASLLATESFQRGLSELHELYKLKNSLSRWSQQLSSFDDMMVTRTRFRTEKIKLTNQALLDQNADQWLSQQQALAAQVQKAVDIEDHYFFMTEEQIDFHQQILATQKRLADFPEGDRRMQFVERLKRAQAYFEWWLSESYSANRWRAQKQVIALNREMALFKDHHRKLLTEMESNSVSEQLTARVSEGRERLTLIEAELELSLDQTRNNLIQLVKKELKRQNLETQDYLLASREAEARLSDLIYRNMNIAGGELETETEVGEAE